MTETMERALSDCEHKISGTNCKKCGIYIHASNSAIKTNYFDSTLNCSAKNYLVHLRKRQSLVL